jgi:hypothetical protein
MNDRAALAGLALLVGGALVLVSRRQAAALAPAGEGAENATDFEEITVTAARLPEHADAADGLEEITVTASRLPVTPVSVVVDAVAEAVAVVKSVFKARGLRNNNPGNIERNGTKWLGMAPEQTDPRFVVFVHPSYGVRALGRILRTYERRGLVTVRDIIGRWAPSTENDTSAYAAAVARALGVTPGERINVSARLPELAAAIVQHENGSNPYSAADLAAWVNMA